MHFSASLACGKGCFHTTRLWLVNQRTRQYQSKKRRRFHQSAQVPLRQTNAQRSQTVEGILRAKQQAGGSVEQQRKLEQRLYSRGARLDREERWRGQQVNTTYALQGLGDLEPLRNSRQFGFSEREALKYDSPKEAMRYDAPPVPYTPLAARKLAEGNLWPAAPEPSEMSGVMGKEVRLLRHRENMSPSAQHFSDKLAYLLRRSIRACPPHIAERIDFAQLIIQEVIASRRSKSVYIVWGTVDPGARWELEPHLLRLHYWVRRLVFEKMKSRPNIPQQIHWVYDGDRVERELPRKLVGELKSMVGDVSSSMETRVSYLKALDTVQHKMKDIPWFMPYLWNKEEKAAKSRRLRSDVAELERRRVEAKTAQGAVAKEQHQALGRSSAPQMSAPPSFVS